MTMWLLTQDGHWLFPAYTTTWRVGRSPPPTYTTHHTPRTKVVALVKSCVHTNSGLKSTKTWNQLMQITTLMSVMSVDTSLMHVSQMINAANCLAFKTLCTSVQDTKCCSTDSQNASLLQDTKCCSSDWQHVSLFNREKRLHRLAKINLIKLHTMHQLFTTVFHTKQQNLFISVTDNKKCITKLRKL